MDSVDEAVKTYRDYTIDSLMCDTPTVKSIRRYIMKQRSNLSYNQRLYDSADSVLQMVKRYEANYGKKIS